MRKWEYKTFKDNVHGYIKMPMPFVKKLIDTELFQRLRYIEQTGMRTLYPSARHDRFIHSLGTYYLGAKAYSAFHENVKRRYSSESKSKRNHYLVAGSKGKNEIWWEKFGVLFTIACLLHDCGHAPFSHTLEYIYDMKIMGPDNDVLNLNENLVKQYTSSSFSADFGKGTGSEHERMSALLVKTEYGDAIKEIINDEFDSPIKCSEEDIEFIARSIIGCVYKDTTSKENQIKNCFIQLLNSKSIDVDKLDYIVRDAILSGLDNTSIDIDRLLESLTIIETTQVTQCPLDKYEFDTVVLEGDITGNIDANIKGVVFANNFNGTINGQVCISGSAQIVNDVKFKDGYVKINGTEHRNASIILHNASIDINAEFCDDIELKDAKFKSTEQMNARITTKEEAQIHMSSVYLKGSVTGMFTGKVLGFFDKAKAEVKIEPAFHKSSLSVIQNVITARNYEYLWIYAHHKVAYYANYLLIFVLKQSIQYLLKESESADEGLKRILSMDKKTNWNQRVFYRTNDSDIIALFKECYLRNNMSESKDAKLDTLYNEFFTRNYKKSVWKSHAEFNLFFNELSNEEKTSLLRVFRDNSISMTNTNQYGFLNDVWSKIFEGFGLNDVVWVNANISINDLNTKKIFILLKDKPIRLSDVNSIETYINNTNLFYLYYDGDFISEKNFNSLISFLKEKAKEDAKKR